MTENTGNTPAAQGRNSYAAGAITALVALAIGVGSTYFLSNYEITHKKQAAQIAEVKSNQDKPRMPAVADQANTAQLGPDSLSPAVHQPHPCAPYGNWSNEPTPFQGLLLPSGEAVVIDCGTPPQKRVAKKKRSHRYVWR